MHNLEWVKKEIDIAIERGFIKGDTEYSISCYSSALQILDALYDDKPSWWDIVSIKNIINDLIEDRPLTPIEDIPEIWNETVSRRGLKVYQCLRKSSLFKYVSPNGKVTYSDINRGECIYVNNPRRTFYSGIVNNIINNMYPISMPYIPDNIAIKVYCADALSDPKHGDFDTLAVFYAILPDGKKVNINKFYKETELDLQWSEITLDEFKERFKMDSNIKGYTSPSVVSIINEIERGECSVFYADGKVIFTEVSDSDGNSSTINQSIDPTLNIKVTANKIVNNISNGDQSC